MPDGTRLAATVWLPDSADAQRVPAILEVLPYRKRDHTAARDFQNHGYFAEAGFAGVRVDMRGTGDSEGLFDARETYSDILIVLEWLRSQPWCSGDLGIVGLSWGGMNAMMAAAEQPPGLKAVVACSFAFDRYDIGMLWKNACLLNENFAWATAVTSSCTRPPDPAVVGEGWRTMWLGRLENLHPLIYDYLGHQRRDEYWDAHGVADLSRIECPLYMFGGWADSNYTQSLPILMDAAAGPRRAVFGPWGHKYPHFAMPGPGIDFLGEATRWFSRWLKDDGEETDGEPQVLAYMLKDLPAQPAYGTAPGRWIAETWPPANLSQLALRLGNGTLGQDEVGEASLSFRSPQTTGLGSGEVMPWFAAGPGPELPGDQREDDGKSLTFDSAPLEEAMETLGAPVLELEFSVDRPTAFLAIRICDVKPDGTSARVNLGLHNLTRRNGDREPVALAPGERYFLSMPLDFKGYVFKAGHRIRLALSTTYWPMIWPSPEPVTLTVHTGRSTLRLPQRVSGDQTVADPLGKPSFGPGLARTQIVPAKQERTVSHDLATGETRVRIAESDGTYRLDDIDWEVASKSEETHRIVGDDPLSAGVEISRTWAYRRGEWNVRTETLSRLSATKDAFICRLEVRAFEGEEKVFSRDWDIELPRDML